jgi:hypothetical protein
MSFIADTSASTAIELYKSLNTAKEAGNAFCLFFSVHSIETYFIYTSQSLKKIHNLHIIPDVPNSYMRSCSSGNVKYGSHETKLIHAITFSVDRKNFTFLSPIYKNV